MCITALALANPTLPLLLLLQLRQCMRVICHLTSLLPQNPGVSDVYIEHSVQATVAQYAPSGYYIASGGKHACRQINIVYMGIYYALACENLACYGQEGSKIIILLLVASLSLSVYNIEKP